MSLLKICRLNSLRSVFVRGVKSSSSKSKDEDFLGEEMIEESMSSEDVANNVGRERSLNRVQLIGRVGADPKVGGSERHKVVTFNLATNEYAGVNTNSGDIKQRVDWHRIAVFQPRLLDNAEKYVRQGDRIYIQGRLHHNRIRDKQSGEDRYVSSIIADDMIFLTKK